MIRRLEHLSYEKRLKKLGFSVRRRQGSKNTSLQPSNTYRELEGNQLFTRSDSDRIRGNGFKGKEGRFRLDRGKIFSEKVMRCLNRFSTPGVVQS